MNSNTTVSTASAQAIALARFVETSLITLLPMALLAALTALQAQLMTPGCSPTSAPGPGGAACAFHWEWVLYAFVAALVSGAINALTAFVSKTHAIATTPQAVVGEVIPTPGKAPDAIAGTTVPGTPGA